MIARPVRLSAILWFVPALAIASCSGPRCSTQALDIDGGALLVQPYLQDVTESGVTVMWWTTEPTGRHAVELFDGSPDRPRTIEATSAHDPSMDATLHRAVIDGIASRDAVRYRVRSGATTSATYTLRTSRFAADGFRLAALGDGRTDDDAVVARHREITRVALARRPQLALQSGDMVRTGDRDQWLRFLRRIATASDPDDPGTTLASTVPYYLVVGNHELCGGSFGSMVALDGETAAAGGDRFRAVVDNPPNGSATPAWAERYYSFDYGPATFIVLDTNNTSDDELDNSAPLPDGATPDWEPGSEQHRWLERELARAEARSALTFVAMHPAPFCRGAHGAPRENQGSSTVRALEPLFRAHGVDAVISAHDHLVERSLTGPTGYEAEMDDAAPSNLNWFVNGNAGHSTRQAGDGWERWMSVRGDGAAPFYSRYFYDWAGTTHTSYLEVDVARAGASRWRATFRTVRDDGRIFDELSLERDEPAPRASPVTPAP